MSYRKKHYIYIYFLFLVFFFFVFLKYHNEILFCNRSALLSNKVCSKKAQCQAVATRQEVEMFCCFCFQGWRGAGGVSHRQRATWNCCLCELIRSSTFKIKSTAPPPHCKTNLLHRARRRLIETYGPVPSWQHSLLPSRIRHSNLNGEENNNNGTKTMNAEVWWEETVRDSSARRLSQSDELLHQVRGGHTVLQSLASAVSFPVKPALQRWWVLQVRPSAEASGELGRNDWVVGHIVE